MSSFVNETSAATQTPISVPEPIPLAVITQPFSVPVLPVLEEPKDVINNEYWSAKFKEASGIAEDQELTIEMINPMMFKLFLNAIRSQHAASQFQQENVELRRQLVENDILKLLDGAISLRKSQLLATYNTYVREDRNALLAELYSAGNCSSEEWFDELWLHYMRQKIRPFPSKLDEEIPHYHNPMRELLEFLLTNLGDGMVWKLVWEQLFFYIRGKGVKEPDFLIMRRYEKFAAASAAAILGEVKCLLANPNRKFEDLAESRSSAEVDGFDYACCALKQQLSLDGLQFPEGETSSETIPGATLKVPVVVTTLYDICFIKVIVNVNWVVSTKLPQYQFEVIRTGWMPLVPIGLAPQHTSRRSIRGGMKVNQIAARDTGDQVVMAAGDSEPPSEQDPGPLGREEMEGDKETDTCGKEPVSIKAPEGFKMLVRLLCTPPEVICTENKVASQVVVNDVIIPLVERIGRGGSSDTYLCQWPRCLTVTSDASFIPTGASTSCSESSHAAVHNTTEAVVKIVRHPDSNGRDQLANEAKILQTVAGVDWAPCLHYESTEISTVITIAHCQDNLPFIVTTPLGTPLIQYLQKEACNQNQTQRGGYYFDIGEEMDLEATERDPQDDEQDQQARLGGTEGPGDSNVGARKKSRVAATDNDEVQLMNERSHKAAPAWLEELATKTVTQLKNDIAEAWGVGILHLDIRPDNIIMTTSRCNPSSNNAITMPLLIDWGSAKHVPENKKLGTGASIVGIPAFQADYLVKRFRPLSSAYNKDSSMSHMSLAREELKGIFLDATMDQEALAYTYSSILHGGALCFPPWRWRCPPKEMQECRKEWYEEHEKLCSGCPCWKFQKNIVKFV